MEEEVEEERRKWRNGNYVTHNCLTCGSCCWHSNTSSDPKYIHSKHTFHSYTECVFSGVLQYKRLTRAFLRLCMQYEDTHPYTHTQTHVHLLTPHTCDRERERDRCSAIGSIPAEERCCMRICCSSGLTRQGLVGVVVRERAGKENDGCKPTTDEGTCK